MDSDFQQQQYQHHFQETPRQFHPQKQQTGGLTRFRSAPSSYFASFLDVAADTVASTGGGSGGGGQRRDFANARPLSPETENIFDRAAAPSSTGIASIPHMKTGGGGNIHNNSSLTRHSSSPAGFFAKLNIDTSAYGMIGGIRNYGGGNGGNVQVNTSSGQPPTSGLINQNLDVGAKRLKMDNPEESSFTNPSINHNDSNYEFPMNSWDDSILSENFTSLDGTGDEDRKIFPELNASENQSGDGKNRPPPLTHHLSLPKTLPELSNMEKFLQYQDSVPLRIRAKRGCATHPRSIAERVRRTKISERMRKLQDLVPNMDKQTNTADMLDLAVDYIKELQNEVEIIDAGQQTVAPAVQKLWREDMEVSISFSHWNGRRSS
nr:hypothetical protein [Suaeda aralocaspica]